MENSFPYLAVSILQVALGLFLAEAGINIGRKLKTTWGALAIGAVFILAVVPIKLLLQPTSPVAELIVQSLCIWSLMFGASIVGALKRKVETDKN